jgi:hypothetical protein
MKTCILLSFLAVLFHSSCNYTFETGIEHPTAGATSAIAGNDASAVATGAAGTLFTLQPETLAGGGFSKIAPADGANVALNPTLYWSTDKGVKRYQFCVDTTNNKTCDTAWNDVGTSTSVFLSGKYGLAYATTYYWQVRAVKSGATTETNGGLWWSFTTPFPAPGAFSKLYPGDGSITGINAVLSWTASVGSKGYVYCVDTTKNDSCDSSWISIGTAQSVTLGNLSYATTYYWQARAARSGVTTDADAGKWWSFTTEIGAFSKTAPANGADVTMYPILSWTKNESANINYYYCVDTVNNNVCDTSWNWLGSNNEVGMNGLSLHTTYYWQVRAATPDQSVEADNGVWWSFTTFPIVPGPFSKSAPADGSIIAYPKLYWMESNGTERYLFCFDTINNDVCDTAWNDVGTITALFLGSKYGIRANTTYYWQVEAVASGATTQADGGVWWSFTTPPTIPGPFAKTSPADGSNTAIDPTLSWTDSDGVDRYLVCVDTTNNDTCDTGWGDVGTSTRLYLNSKYGLTAGTTYYWQVKAADSLSSSTEADGGTWWSFTTDPSSPSTSFKNAPANGVSSNSASRYSAAKLMFFPSIAYFVTTGKEKEPLLYRFRGMRNFP